MAGLFVPAHDDIAAIQLGQLFREGLDQSLNHLFLGFLYLVDDFFHEEILLCLMKYLVICIVCKL